MVHDIVVLGDERTRLISDLTGDRRTGKPLSWSTMLGVEVISLLKFKYANE